MTEIHIDPIPIREELQRLQGAAEVLRLGVDGAHALVWFKEYAVGVTGVEVKANVVASSTPNAGVAEGYLKRAAAAFADVILEKAVAAAKRDFEAAVALRKPKPKDQR